MPAHRKPTKVLKFTGSVAKNPARYETRADEPVPSGPIGKPPVYFTLMQIAAWEQIAAEIPPDVAGNADNLMLEGYALLVDSLRQGSIAASGLTVSLKALALLPTYAAHFGMSPSSRSKVKAYATPNAAPTKKTFASV